jgi:hypothetical protein
VAGLASTFVLTGGEAPPVSPAVVLGAYIYKPVQVAGRNAVSHQLPTSPTIASSESCSTGPGVVHACRRHQSEFSSRSPGSRWVKYGAAGYRGATHLPSDGSAERPLMLGREGEGETTLVR